MQFEIGFDSSLPMGIFSGRPWQAQTAIEPDLVDRMRRDVPLPFQVSDQLLQILGVRGISSPRELERFFYPAIEHLHDPFLLKEMEPAVERMFQAARRGEKVAVHGDFDVDGLTGCALLVETLFALEQGGGQTATAPRVHPRPGHRRLRSGRAHDSRMVGGGREVVDHR